MEPASVAGGPGLRAVTGPPAREGGAAPGPSEEARLREVARDFEAIFLSHLLRQMREATAQRGIFQAGGGLRTYQGIADDEFGRALARAGGIGLAATLGRELRRLVPAPAGGSSRAAIRPMIFPDAALPPSGGPP